MTHLIEEFNNSKKYTSIGIEFDAPCWEPEKITHQHLLIGPVVFRGHWWCYAVNRRDRMLYVIDSLTHHPQGDRKKLDSWMAKKFEEIMGLLDQNFLVTGLGLPIKYAVVPKQPNQ
ncbi:hypothetical protein PIB30_112001 [Stylosanthes scabra]|uniref:Ubiquitin-like protease family profile domain-containing protein n=1 Tax=Stylosanthes scabra TaxID=79078 RepID=A0ABU6TZX0_9FABA|nr:hypothetical protein [Stylosanthes scabra]